MKLNRPQKQRANAVKNTLDPKKTLTWKVSLFSMSTQWLALDWKSIDSMVGRLMAFTANMCHFHLIEWKSIEYVPLT